MSKLDPKIDSSSRNGMLESTRTGDTRQNNQALNPSTNGVVDNPNNDLTARKANFTKGLKIAAIIAGAGTAITGIPSIIGATLAAFTAIAFLPYTAILTLGILAAGLAITTIGLAIASHKNKKAAEQARINSQNPNLNPYKTGDNSSIRDNNASNKAGIQPTESNSASTTPSNSGNGLFDNSPSDNNQNSPKSQALIFTPSKEESTNLFDTQTDKEKSVNTTATATPNPLSSSSNTNKSTSDTLPNSAASEIKRKNNDSEKNLSATNSSDIVETKSEQIEINNSTKSSAKDAVTPTTSLKATSNIKTNTQLNKEPVRKNFSKSEKANSTTNKKETKVFHSNSSAYSDGSNKPVQNSNEKEEMQPAKPPQSANIGRSDSEYSVSSSSSKVSSNKPVQNSNKKEETQSAKPHQLANTGRRRHKKILVNLDDSEYERGSYSSEYYSDDEERTQKSTENLKKIAKNLNEAEKQVQKAKEQSPSGEISTEEKIEIVAQALSPNENVDSLGTVESEEEEVSIDEILEQWPKLTLEFVKVSEDVLYEAGSGGFGAVTEAFATFTRLVSQMAKEPRDHLKVKIVAKDDKNFEAENQKFTNETNIPFIKNEVLINYVLTQYITQNYSKISGNQELKTCFRGIPLLILSKEQKELLSEAHNCDELVQIVQDNIEKFGRIYFESKQHLDLNVYLPLPLDGKYSVIEGLFKQALMQLAFLNHLGIAHRDIKPQNMRINTDNNTLSLLDFGTSYLNLGAAEKFYGDENTITETKQIYGAPPEAYENPYKLNPIAENEFGFGALLLMMLFPSDWPGIIAKYCNPGTKQNSIVNEIGVKFNEIYQDEYFKENFAKKKKKRKKKSSSEAPETREEDLDGAKFFNNRGNLVVNSKSCEDGLEAAQKLRAKLSASPYSEDSKAQALLRKIEEFEAAVSGENKEFLELCEKNTDENGDLNNLSTDFDQMKIEGWKNLYNDIEKIVKNSEKILNKEKVSKNYTEEDQDKIIELLKGFLNPDPQKRFTCEGALQKYFSTTLDFSNLPKLENFDIFNTQKRN